jgi:hypothetical protein
VSRVSFGYIWSHIWLRLWSTRLKECLALADLRIKCFCLFITIDLRLYERVFEYGNSCVSHAHLLVKLGFLIVSNFYFLFRFIIRSVCYLIWIVIFIYDNLDDLSVPVFAVLCILTLDFSFFNNALWLWRTLSIDRGFFRLARPWSPFLERPLLFLCHTLHGYPFLSVELRGWFLKPFRFLLNLFDCILKLVIVQKVKVDTTSIFNCFPVCKQVHEKVVLAAMDVIIIIGLNVRR